MVASTPAPGFHDATVIDALEPSVWLELFDAFGAPPGFERERTSIEYIVERLSVSGLPEPLQLALEWMYNLGSEDGIERLTSAARESNVDLSALRSAAPVEFVARVAILSTTNDAARRALDRAQTGALVAALPASRVHEFRGRTGKPLERLDERVADLRWRLTSWLDGLGLGDRVDVTLKGAFCRVRRLTPCAIAPGDEKGASRSAARSERPRRPRCPTRSPTFKSTRDGARA